MPVFLFAAPVTLAMLVSPAPPPRCPQATELPVVGERDCVELMQLVGLGGGARGGHDRAAAVTMGWEPRHAMHRNAAACAHRSSPSHLPPAPPRHQGIANRAVSATAMNAGSSRSHCVIYVVVEKAHGDGRVEFGKLCLVVGDAC